MNKKKPKNELNHQKKGNLKACKLKNKTKNNSKWLGNSEIDFLVNVSSSGINLGKKIEQEMAKLETIEKKIRVNKCKNGKVNQSQKVTSYNAYNQMKLQNIFEDIVASFNSRHLNKRKRALSPSKFTKKGGQIRKSISNTIVVDSLLNLQEPKKNKLRIKEATITKGIKCRKIKKASSASVEILYEDLKFAENFNVDSIEKEKPKIEVVIEKTSKDNIQFIYDAISLKSMKSCSMEIIDENFANYPVRAKIIRPKQQQKFSNTSNKLSYKEKKYSRKFSPTVYSFKEKHIQEEIEQKKINKKRPNSNTHEETALDPEIYKSNDQINSNVIVVQMKSDKHSNVTNSKSNLKNQTMNNSIIRPDTGNNIKKKLSGDRASTENYPENLGKFENLEETAPPIELLERSILAVENVLRTINSMTNDFNIHDEIKCLYAADETIINQFTDYLKLDSMDQLSKVPKNNSFSNNDSSCILVNIKSSKNLREKLALSEMNKKQEVFMVKDKSKEVLYLKEPQMFCESEESITDCSKISRYSSNRKEKIEPLKQKLSSLRVRVNAIQDLVSCSSCNSKKFINNIENSISIEHSEISQNLFSNSEEVERNNFSNEFFTTETPCSTNSSFNPDYTSHAIRNYYCKNEILSKTNTPYHRSTCIRQNSKNLNITEERNHLNTKLFFESDLEKCLMLLNKKFRDFDFSRQKKILRKPSSNLKKFYVEQYEEVSSQSLILNGNMSLVTDSLRNEYSSKEMYVNNNYETCFENENFKYSSVTSVDSANRSNEQ